MFVKIITQTREELIELCRNEPEKAADIMLALQAAIDRLEERIQKLEEQLKKDSHNSHKPPSSDEYKRKTKTSRSKSKRSRGGQEGHQGTTLKMVETPHHTITHQLRTCNRCGSSLRRIKPLSYTRRQVFDIPEPKVEVTEHQCEVKQCPRCGTTTTARFPDGLTKAVQYGKNLKSIAMYLKQYQLLPSDRLQETLRDLFGCSLSEGTFFNWDKELYVALETHQQHVKEQLHTAPVVHVDETGLLCEQKLHWLHVISTANLSYYLQHPKRGTEAMDAIGILPNYQGIAVHDFWKSYFSYQCGHSLCNAHLLRELEFVAETTHQRWPKQFQNLLRNMHTLVEKAKQKGLSTLQSRKIKYYEHRYTILLSKALRANPRQRGSPHRRGRKKQTPVRNLVERLRDHQISILRFIHDFRVPFTNNQAERDLRMMKVKLKISGTFRSQHGAECFCRVRGYISTAKKNGISAFEALVRAFNRDPFVPILKYAE